MARVRTALEGLKRRVEQGRVKAPEKSGAAARILAQHHGHRYYDWRYSEGTFDFFPHRLSDLRGKHGIGAPSESKGPLSTATSTV
jgi:hypothetical protein